MSICESIGEVLVATARGETISAADRTLLEDHTGACPECRCRLANQRMLTAGLAAVASQVQSVPPPVVSAAVKAALMAELRPKRRPMTVLVGLTAVAAVAAVLFLVASPRQQTAGVPKEPVVAPMVKAPPTGQEQAIPPSTLPQRSARRHRRRPQVQSPHVEETREAATDFFEIPYSEPLRPSERADVFRVRMPRANMAAFGLPVSGGSLDSRIVADVLVGEDGVARAIRFIR